jgi:hypothetical protein
MSVAKHLFLFFLLYILLFIIQWWTWIPYLTYIIYWMVQKKPFKKKQYKFRFITLS